MSCGLDSTIFWFSFSRWHLLKFYNMPWLTGTLYKSQSTRSWSAWTTKYTLRCLYLEMSTDTTYGARVTLLKSGFTWLTQYELRCPDSEMIWCAGLDHHNTKFEYDWLTTHKVQTWISAFGINFGYGVWHQATNDNVWVLVDYKVRTQVSKFRNNSEYEVQNAWSMWIPKYRLGYPNSEMIPNAENLLNESQE